MTVEWSGSQMMLCFDLYTDIYAVYSVILDTTPLPAPLAEAAADEAQFDDEPWVEAPVYMDYGTQVRLGKGVFINAHSTWIDTSIISVGARTLFGPHGIVFHHPPLSCSSIVTGHEFGSSPGRAPWGFCSNLCPSTVLCLASVQTDILYSVDI